MSVGLVHDEEASEVMSRGLWEWEIALKNLRRGMLIDVGVVDIGFVVYWSDFFYGSTERRHGMRRSST